MKPWKALLLAILMVGACISSLPAQWTLAATGGNASGSAGVSSYTAGQVAYLGINTTNGSVFQGVQQPFYLVGVEEVNDISLSCSLFPNPAAGDVTLKVDDFASHDLRYLLYDLQGRVIASGDIGAPETQIPISNLPAATYLLTVGDLHHSFVTFKIIKTL